MTWETDIINAEGTIWRRNAIDRVHWESCGGPTSRSGSHKAGMMNDDDI